MSSVDGSKDWLVGLLAVVTGFGLSLAGATGVQAQDLPSADELESEDASESDSAFEESSSSDDASEEESSDDEGEETDASESEGATEGSQPSEAAAGDETSSESGPADTSGTDKQATTGDPNTAEKREKASESAEKAEESAADEKKADAEGETSKDGDGERGEIVNTETDTEKEVKGRGAVEGDVRWVQSGLNAHGVPGLQHAASAEAQKPNTYHVGFFGEVSGGSNMIRAGDQNTYAAGRMLVHAQIIEYFSANIGLEARNNVNNFGRPNAMLSQGDLTLGLRGHYSVLEYLHLAGDLTLDFPTGFGAAGIDFAGTSVRPRAMGTLEINPLIEEIEFPMVAHLNLGYRVDNSRHTVPDDVEPTRVERFAHGISAFNAVELGLGVEYDLPYVSPFAEWNVHFPVGGPDDICSGRQTLQCPQQQGFASFPDKISFGLRGEPVEQLSLHAGVDLSLTARQAAGVPTTAPYKVFVGANWNIDPEPRVERVTKTVEKTRLVEEMPERGRIVGEVRDKESEMPVGGAQISYPDSDRSPQMAGTDNGAFRSYGFEPGKKVMVHVSHPDYKTKKVEVAIGKGKKNMEFALAPKNKKGTLSGTVTDASGAGIAGATVVADGPETREATTDSSGNYSLEVKEGSYTVGVSASDYAPTTKEVQVTGGKSQTVGVSLQQGGADLSKTEIADGKIKIDGRIAFASGTANIDSGSKDTLDAVAATIKARPDVEKIEVAGHTDDVGSKEANMTLSEKRAEAVVDYLVDQGISRTRLKAEGYGPEQPMVPNISDRNRRMNRRVEFKILE